MPLVNLSNYLKVSERTVRSDIQKINDYIINHGAEVIHLRKQGYQLKITDKKQFESFWQGQDSGTFLFSSSKERIQYLIRVFLTTDRYISKDYLLEIFFIGLNTLYTDLRTLKKILDTFHLRIVNKSNLGYTCKGKEENIRKAINYLIFQDDITEFITGGNTILKDICLNIDYHKFSKLFTEYLSNLVEKESDYFHQIIFSSLLLSTSRVKEGHELLNPVSPKIKLIESAEDQINQFIRSLENEFTIIINSFEIDYIKYVISENSPNIIDVIEYDLPEKKPKQIVTHIINFLKSQTSEKWIESTSLRKNLEGHISRLLTLYSMEGSRNNPILDTIKNSFPFPFELAVKASLQIEKEFNLTLSENDISYVALYFANSIEKYRAEQKSKETFQIAIVCGTGTILSSIIESKIKRKFSQDHLKIEKFSFLEFNNLYKHHPEDHKFDIIFSTIPLKESFQRLISLDLDNFNLALEEAEEKLKEIFITRNKTKLSYSLFTEENFLFQASRISKLDLIEKVSKKLVNRKNVNENFLSDIIERESISDTILDDTIALPHPIGDSVLKSCIYAVIAPKGIMWSNKKIKFIFFMAIKKDDAAQLQPIYSHMLNFIESKEKQEQLLKNPTFDSLVELVFSA